MKFPAENSAVEHICKYLKDCGPATAQQVQEVTGHSINSVSVAFAEGFLSREDGGKSGYIYALKPHVRDYLARGGDYKGEIVEPAQPRPFKPLTGYTASLTRNLREPIRDMSFMRTSSQCLPRA
jgi:hypothetical protein